MFFKRKIKLVTHDATFHADEVFATACLKIYFKKVENRGIRIIRSRDQKILDTGDIVYDVGQVYDPKTNRYDHHQTGGAGFRENTKVPYSAFGLIWKHFGDKLVSSADIHREIDEKFVQQICAGDTGFMDLKIAGTDWTPIHCDGVIRSFNPFDSQNPKDSNKIFKKVVLVVEQILEKLIEKHEKAFSDSIKVLESYEKSPDKRFVVLDKYYLWRRSLIEKQEPLYVIFPSFGADNYHITAIPVKEGTFELRKPFPESWRGKKGEELHKITGNSGAEFVHNSGFMAVADNLENALDLVQKSLAN